MTPEPLVEGSQLPPAPVAVGQVRVPSTTPVAVVAVCAIIVIVLVGVGSLFIQARVAGILDALHRDAEITSCRSAYNAELIAGPTFGGLKALSEGVDSDAFREALVAADEDRYEELVRLSRVDPDAFVDQCRRDDPGSS